jgi:FkbM family methyltransferase
LKEIDKDNVTLLELGAGWGEWCLALAGVVNFGLVPHRVRKFNYLAVEGEPYYCELINKHFEFNMLPMNVLNCAVSDKDGYCYFDKFSGEQNHFDTWCTQGMTFRGNISGSKLKTLLMAGYRLLRRELVKVPMYKLDTILDKYEIYPDIIQMDIVGMEAKVIKSTKYFPMYWIIGTHHRNINRDIWQFLNLRYECLLNIEPPIKKTNGLAQDGLQVFKKR